MLYIFEIDSYIIPVEFSVFARAYLGHVGFWDMEAFGFCDGQDQKGDQTLYLLVIL